MIDHHPSSRLPSGVIPFQDVRPQAAASASIATAYLWELKQEPHERLATALLYAIRTETRGFETEHSTLDRRAVRWLTRWANPTWIAEIESAPLSRSYFGDLTLALQSTFLYDDAAFCLLPRADGAEVVGEVADLLIRCEGVRRVLCAAVVEDAILVSVRTAEDREDAGELVQDASPVNSSTVSKWRVTPTQLSIAAEALRARLRLSYSGRSRRMEFGFLGVVSFVHGGVGNASRWAHDSCWQSRREWYC